MSFRVAHSGDLFADGADCIVIPVNCVGVMGAGVAKVCAQRYPDVFAIYKAACDSGALRPGTTLIVERPQAPTHVALLPTKDHWRQPSQLEWVKSGLVDLERAAQDPAISSISMPALGAGLGGLAFAPVQEAVEQWSEQLPDHLHITLYAPR